MKIPESLKDNDLASVDDPSGAEFPGGFDVPAVQVVAHASLHSAHLSKGYHMHTNTKTITNKKQLCLHNFHSGTLICRSQQAVSALLQHGIRLLGLK